MYSNPELVLIVARDRVRDLIAEAESGRVLSAARRRHSRGRVAGDAAPAAKVDSHSWHRRVEAPAS